MYAVNEALRVAASAALSFAPSVSARAPDVAQKRAPTSAKRQLVVFLAPEDFAHLEAACLVFGIGKSELVRRLIRASVDIGPALSFEDGQKLAPIGKELRAIGRNEGSAASAARRDDRRPLSRPCSFPPPAPDRAAAEVW